MGRTMLVAVTGGENSTYALSWCVNNIVSADDKILLLHVVSPPPGWTLDPAAIMIPDGPVDKEDMEAAHTFLLSLCSDSQFKVERKVEVGDPRKKIGEVADNMGVDFVVLGGDGDPWARFFGGSVAADIRCPVLIIKPPVSS